MGISAAPRADHQIATCRCKERPIILPAAPVPLPAASILLVATPFILVAASVLLFGAPLLGPASSPLGPVVSVLQHPAQPWPNGSSRSKFPYTRSLVLENSLHPGHLPLDYLVPEMRWYCGLGPEFAVLLLGTCPPVSWVTIAIMIFCSFSYASVLVVASIHSKMNFRCYIDSYVSLFDADFDDTVLGDSVLP